MTRRFWSFLGSLCVLTVSCTAPSERLLADSPNSAPTHGRSEHSENYLPVQRLSAEGSRGSGVDLAAGPDGTVWLLWAEKGAAQPERGHASADDLYIDMVIGRVRPGCAHTGQLTSRRSEVLGAKQSAGGS